jgi:hypothetical protein
MAVATQEVFYHTDALVETWDLGAATPALTLVSKNGRFGVSLTNTAGITTKRTKTLGPYEISAPTFAGVGNEQATAIGDHAAGVAVDGTWEFEGITGVTTSTTQSTPVYVTGAGALTLTATGSTKVGEINFPATYAKAAGVAPVKIGV